MPDQDRRESEAGDAVVPETEEAAEPQIPEVEPEAEAVAEAPKSYEELHRPFHVEMMDSVDEYLGIEEYEREGIDPSSLLGFIKDVSILGKGVFIPEEARETFCLKLIQLNVHYLGRYGEDMPMLAPELVRFMRSQLGDEAAESILVKIGMVWFECPCGRCGNKVVVPAHIGEEGYVSWKREQLRQKFAERTGLDVRQLGVYSLLDEQGQPIGPEGAFGAIVLSMDGGMLTTDPAGIARLMKANADGNLEEVAQAMIKEGVATQEGAAAEEVSGEQPTEEGAPATEVEEEPSEEDEGGGMAH